MATRATIRRSIFVIGGDAPEPAWAVPRRRCADRRALLQHDTPLANVGFGGYPDGHADIPLERLMPAVLQKQQMLDDAGITGWVSTQMCFDVKAITKWTQASRSAGLHLPLHLGIPGVIDTTKLLTMGAKLGIGASLRYLRKNRAVVSKLAAPGGYDPMELLAPLAPSFTALGIEALHVFTFNQVANTAAWRAAALGQPNRSPPHNQHEINQHQINQHQINQHQIRSPFDMAFPSDLDIAQAATLEPLHDIAAQMGIGPHLIEPYGDSLAKIKLSAVSELADRPKAKYIVVSAITPTPLGEGKTTTTVGLGQAFKHIGKKSVIAIRQPSMGPTFGIKGGAAGGGYSQVIPMELLNLHLTGDFHAVTSAHNMLSAVFDNHLHQGNELGLDLNNITWRRVLDINERALRNIIIGLGTKEDGVTRQTGFDITAASEVMAIFALCTSLKDMRERLGRIVVGYTVAGDPVTAGGAPRRRRDGCDHARRAQAQPDADTRGHPGARTCRPLRQYCPWQQQHHCGPDRYPWWRLSHHRSRFRCRHGRRTVLQHQMPRQRFGSGCGSGRRHCATPSRLTAAITRSLLARHCPENLLKENPNEVHIGGANLRKQIENIRIHGVTPVVAINAFPGDFDSEHAAIREIAESMGVRVAVCTHFANGGKRSHRAGRSSSRGRRRAEFVPGVVPIRGQLEDQDRNGRHQGLRRGQGGVLRCRQRNWPTTKRTASATCRCASPRPTCRFRPMLR